MSNQRWAPYDFPGFKAAPSLQGDYPIWKFTYTNWKGETHMYVVDVEGIEFTARGSHQRDNPMPCAVWQLHGVNLERDGEPRPERPRRSFILEKIEHLETIK